MKDKISGIRLYDIKPLTTIEDYSLYYFLPIAILFLIAISAIIYFAFYIYNKKQEKRKQILKFLNNIDFKSIKNANECKQLAYKLSTNLEFFINTKTTNTKKLQINDNIQQTINMLKAYKYKKQIQVFSNKDTKQLKQTIRLING